MPGKWVEIGPLDSSGAQDILSDLADVLDSIADVLNAVQGVVDAVASLILGFESIIKSLITSIISAVEQTILNVLETNAHVAIYSNLKFDETWSWKPKVDIGQSETAPRNNNFLDGDVPFRGTGVSGWIGEVLASTHDTANVFRPVTDSGTATAGVILLFPAPSFSEFQEFIPLAKKLFSFDDFRIEVAEEYQDLPKGQKWKAALGGYFGSRAAELAEGLSEGASSIKEAYSNLDETYQDALPDTAGSFFLNSPGPTWVSAPMSTFLGDDVRRMATALKRFVNSFSFADSPLIQLLNAISKKIDLLEELVRKISDIIDALAALLEALELAKFYFGSESGGGASQFYRNAMVAEGVPNVGPTGFAIGATVLLTVPNTESFISLFDLFGAPVGASFAGLVSEVESAAEEVIVESEEASEVFSEVGFDE